MKINPFRPGSIVGPGVFAGRYQEIKSLDQALFQTKGGNPSHFLIHGERGIGKSSLLYVIQLTAKGVIPTYDKVNLNFVTISISLETNPD